jgi:phosphoglucomutase
MDAGKVTLCGEESFGTSSNHVREKDGLWAVLCWLNILAYHPGKTVSELLQDHWHKFGRHYYSRYDYEALDLNQAKEMIHLLEICDLEGQDIVLKDNFTYQDPIDGSVSKNQGIRILFKNGDRIIYRLSGTGTEGATLRIYLEKYVQDPVLFNQDPAEILKSLAEFSIKTCRIQEITGRVKPDVIT